MERSKIKPVLADIIITADKVTMTASGVIMPDSQTVKPVQTVLAIGPHVIDIKVGDVVEIDPESFPKRKTADAKNDVGAHQYTIDLPIYQDDNKDEFMKIKVHQILWIINE